jgi:chitinase
LSDKWADTDLHFEGDPLDDTSDNLYGSLKQLYILKKKNPRLKVLLSIGGWTYSTNFATPAGTVSGRSTFASSAVSLVQNLGLDGLDIDWEYPTDTIQAKKFVLLLQAVRDALDTYSNSLSTPYHFTLTVACPAGPSSYETLMIAEMDQYIDFWNLMAYDYAGSGSLKTGHQANLFPANDDSTPFDTQTAVNYYISKGVALRNIVIGMPIYGRAFDATAGARFPFVGVGPGRWEPGVYDFKDLPLIGAEEHFDSKLGVSYSYDATKREFISYDNIAVVNQKAAWIQGMELGGAMWWESSADALGSKSLIRSVYLALGGQDGLGLESTPNRLAYPDSIYANLRAGMPDSESASESTFASLATSSLSARSSSTTTSTVTLTTTMTTSTVTVTLTTGTGILTTTNTTPSQCTFSTVTVFVS